MFSGRKKGKSPLGNIEVFPTQFNLPKPYSNLNYASHFTAKQSFSIKPFFLTFVKSGRSRIFRDFFFVANCLSHAGCKVKF